MFGWIAANCVIPIAVFANKFGLFKDNVPETDSLGNVIKTPSIALNGWGIIGCIIIGLTAVSIMKEIIAAYPTYSLTKQVFVGVTKTVIPLAVIWLTCYFLNGVISEVMFCLGTVIICRLVAIPLNPLPKWRYEKNSIEDYSDFFSSFTKLVKEHKGGGS